MNIVKRLRSLHDDDGVLREGEKFMAKYPTSMFDRPHPHRDEQRHQPQARRRGRQARGAARRSPSCRRTSATTRASAAPIYNEKAQLADAKREYIACDKAGGLGPYAPPGTMAIILGAARARHQRRAAHEGDDGAPGKREPGEVSAVGPDVGERGPRRVMEHELRGEGPTAVLVHGLTVDRRVMIEAFDELLADGRRAPARTSICPGHGASPGRSGARLGRRVRRRAGGAGARHAARRRRSRR